MVAVLITISSLEDFCLWKWWGWLLSCILKNAPALLIGLEDKTENDLSPLNFGANFSAVRKDPWLIYGTSSPTEDFLVGCMERKDKVFSFVSWIRGVKHRSVYLLSTFLFSC